MMRILFTGWLIVTLALASVIHAEERQGEPIEIKTAYGTPFDGYLVGEPDSTQGVIIIHDRWGLDNVALDWANRFASKGYLALAPDLYDGRVAAKDDYAHATALMRQMAPEWVDANLKAAVLYLNAKPGRKVSVVGIGYGGGAAMRATVLEPFSVISTVNIFGRLPQDVEQLRVINGPVLALFSTSDDWVGTTEIETFEMLMSRLRNALQTGKVDAGPGFLDRSHAAYDRDEAERVWQRTFDFVAETQ